MTDYDQWRTDASELSETEKQEREREQRTSKEQVHLEWQRTDNELKPWLLAIVRPNDAPWPVLYAEEPLEVSGYSPDEPPDDAANRYALTLLETLVDKFGRPEGWQPLPDMLGKLTQIDNVVSGLLSRAPIAALRDLVEANDDYINGDKGFPFAEALERAKAFLSGATQPPADEHPDKLRLDFLDSQRKWGDCFMVQDMDAGDLYVRPWRYQNRERWPVRIVASDIRTAIDLAMASGPTKGAG